MKIKCLVAISLVFLFQACIPSLHPLYTEDTLVFEEAIVGTWSDGSDQRWEFLKGTNKNYKFIYTNEGEATTYKVHLVKLGNSYFFDFLLDNKDLWADNYISPLIATHTFAKVTWSKDNLDIQFFDYEWLGKLFEQRKIRLKHEVLEEGSTVLTASSEELQKFAEKYAHEEEAFDEPTELSRVQ